MAYEVVMSYHLHMPSYFLGTFTEYPYLIAFYLLFRTALGTESNEHPNHFFLLFQVTGH